MPGKRKGFYILNDMLLLMFALAAIYPFVYILAVSLMPAEDYLRGGLVLFPLKPSLEAYQYIFRNGAILLSFQSTLLITLCGTLTNLFLTTVCAYVMSKTDLKGYKILINLILFTMYFKGGLIPSYMLMRRLGLIDSWFAVILTGAISTHSMLVMRSFFMNIPDSLEEAAMIDGASEPYVLFRIILPISKPVIATIGLFYAVEYWNAYFYPMIYLNSREKWPLQVILREFLFDSTQWVRSDTALAEHQESPMGSQLKMAAVMVAIIPMMFLYPFLQKYFIKGVLLSAVKA